MLSLRYNGCTYKFAHPTSHTRSFSFSLFFNFAIVSSTKKTSSRKILISFLTKMLIKNFEKHLFY